MLVVELHARSFVVLYVGLGRRIKVGLEVRFVDGLIPQELKNDLNQLVSLSPIFHQC